MSGENLIEFEKFINSWKETGQEMALAYEQLYQVVSDFDSVSFSFIARPGVSFSLRPVHKNQDERKFFAIMDVIDDEPGERWLSICFYGDMVTDPEEKGDLVPGGLGGDDGFCFDMYAPDDGMIIYLKERLKQAFENAKN
ncbi:MAG: hypothetical protein OCC45_01610 [Desulfotalea sp.]